MVPRHLRFDAQFQGFPKNYGYPFGGPCNTIMIKMLGVYIGVPLFGILPYSLVGQGISLGRAV